MKELKSIARDSFIAGILIGLGCVANLSVSGGLLGSVLFSLGLITVILQQRWLFTGKIGYLNFTVAREYATLLWCLAWNFVGIGLLCYVFNRYGELNLDTTSLCATKMSESLLSAFIKAIGCGMLMYIAVEGYKRSENLLTVIFPVAIFILCGFDHCVANYGYLAMNGTLWCAQLPVWILGNAAGSLIISKI